VHLVLRCSKTKCTNRSKCSYSQARLASMLGTQYNYTSYISAARCVPGSIYGLYVPRLTSAGSCGFQRRPTPRYNCDPTNCHNKITGTAKQLVLGGLCSSFKSIMLFQCAQIVSITLSESTQDPPAILYNNTVQTYQQTTWIMCCSLSCNVRTLSLGPGPGDTPRSGMLL